MSWNNIESNWNSLKASVQQNWSKLTDEDINKINGNRDLLISTLQEKYGSNRADAQTEVENWQNSQAESGSQNAGSGDEKYNPDYSGSDSNLAQSGTNNPVNNKPGSIHPGPQNDDHEEKSKDQT